MLKDEDRIFQNLYNDRGSDLVSSQNRGDWVNTKNLIENLSKIKLGTNEYCYHAGTKLIDEKVYAIGGRVLNFVCLSENFSFSRTQIIDSIKSLNWNGGFYRKDIAYKVIDE